MVDSRCRAEQPRRQVLKGVACFRAESQVKKLRSTVW